jgi:hypothetical protein
VLLPVHFVGPFLTARFGDARNGPPRAQPKSLAADQFRFFRQTLTINKCPPEVKTGQYFLIFLGITRHNLPDRGQFSPGALPSVEPESAGGDAEGKTMAVAERRWKLARHAVSGKPQQIGFVPEGRWTLRQGYGAIHRPFRTEFHFNAEPGTLSLADIRSRFATAEALTHNEHRELQTSQFVLPSFRAAGCHPPRQARRPPLRRNQNQDGDFKPRNKHGRLFYGGGSGIEGLRRIFAI